MSSYRTVFTRQALDFICRATDDEMRELDAWLDRIERLPGLAGDYNEADDAGRLLPVVCLQYVAITWWTDHAAREVRIIEIDQVG